MRFVALVLRIADSKSNRLFIRLSSLGVLGLTPVWYGSERDSAPRWRTEKTALEPIEPPGPLQVALGNVPVATEPGVQQVSSHPDYSGAGLTDKNLSGFVRRDELETLLQKHTYALDEALRSSEALRRDVAMLANNLRRAKKKAEVQRRISHATSSGPSQANTTDGEVSLIATHAPFNPPAQTEKIARKSTLSPSHGIESQGHTSASNKILDNTQLYLQQNVLSDDPADSNFELSDASLGERRRAMSAAKAASASKEASAQALGLRSTAIFHSMLESDVSDSVDPVSTDSFHYARKSASRHQLAIRGRSSRRGVSGHRLSGATGKPGPQPDTNASNVVRPRQATTLTFNTGPHRSQVQPSRTGRIYRSSPLAASFGAADGVSLNAAAREPASDAPVDSRLRSVENMSHQKIMQLLNKGMKSNCAKNALRRNMPP